MSHSKHCDDQFHTNDPNVPHSKLCDDEFHTNDPNVLHSKQYDEFHTEKKTQMCYTANSVIMNLIPITPRVPHSKQYVDEFNDNDFSVRVYTVNSVMISVFSTAKGKGGSFLLHVPLRSPSPNVLVPLPEVNKTKQINK